MDGLELEMFVNPSRKKKSWGVYIDSIGTNMKLIRERYEDEKTLHANQVLLTGDYDDQTSDEEIWGFDLEAKRQAEIEKKKTFITGLIGQNALS